MSTQGLTTAPNTNGPDPKGFTTWFRGLPVGGRIMLVTIAIIASLNMLGGAVRTILGTDPGGPSSSTYGTAGDGLAAFADLLRAEGVDVVQLRQQLDQVDLDPATALVIAEPLPLEVGEFEAVQEFLGAGGRLVLTGDPSLLGVKAALAAQDSTKEDQRDRDQRDQDQTGNQTGNQAGNRSPEASSPAGLPIWSSVGAPAPARAIAPMPEVAGVSEVETGGRGSWSDVGAMIPVLASKDRVVVAVGDVGAGRLVAIADPTILTNELLGKSDNAAFGLAAVGGGERTTVFAEAAHGVGQAAGLRAFPAPWGWTLVGFFVVALLLIWSSGHRFGPPEQVGRVQPPPRRAFVDALALTLARTGDTGAALDPLRDHARRIVTRAAGLPADASHDEVRDAAVRLGHDGATIDALDPTRPPADPLIIGIAASTIAGRNRPMEKRRDSA